jgi:predicted nucleic acid-binding protein
VTVIIDASVLSAFILEEGEYEKIRRLLLDGTFAPELVLMESINAVLTAQKCGRLDNAQAEKAVEVLLSFVGTNVRILPLENSLALESYHIAKETVLTSYDALYLALAKRLGSSLVSRDPKQLETAKKIGIKTLVL